MADLEAAAFLRSEQHSPKPAKTVRPRLQSDGTFAIGKFLDAMMVDGEAVASCGTANSAGETAELGEIVEKTGADVWRRTWTRASRKSLACCACFAVEQERLVGRLLDPH